MKKILVWLLCAALLLSLCACGAAEGETPAAAEETPVEETPAAEEQDMKDSTAQYEALMKAYEEALATLGSKLDAYETDAVVMTVDGQEITWDVYFYMLYRAIAEYVNQMGQLPPDFNIQLTEEYTLGQPLSEQEVLDAAAAAKEKFSGLVRACLSKM